MKGSVLLGIVRHESMDLTLFIRFGIFTLYCLGLTSAEAVFRDRQQEQLARRLQEYEVIVPEIISRTAHRNLKHAKRQFWREAIRRQRRSVDDEITVQLLVVVEREMISFHGNQSVEEYVLTVMNMVADLYRDPSIGTKINIEVSKLMLLYNMPVKKASQSPIMTTGRWKVSASGSSG
ncbi:A disintegrin and metalloproteinase with thrombospondin motifs 7 [Stylophora pistillata]|uniref:A disintegrin and metalloproteinase with thrombospondin motifs 7 n=1 Tax=Stylophora pistillata TaxID=50429 RepID=A0A2B4RJN7_STYPI|nr:A disintegrin and metalloproteinase with thrombospondin motifs 7 [Stylophora pistillata]